MLRVRASPRSSSAKAPTPRRYPLRSTGARGGPTGFRQPAGPSAVTAGAATTRSSCLRRRRPGRGGGRRLDQVCCHIDRGQVAVGTSRDPVHARRTTPARTRQPPAAAPAATPAGGPRSRAPPGWSGCGRSAIIRGPPIPSGSPGTAGARPLQSLAPCARSDARLRAAATLAGASPLPSRSRNSESETKLPSTA